MSVKKSLATAGSAAGVIACCVAFTPTWEGYDFVAKRDMIGTGHPMTYCNGQTDEFGKVKAGTRFTKKQCDEMLAESLPKYLAPLEKCVKVDLPDKTMASLLDAAYNAGPAAVCRSPMVTKMNAGNLRGGCNAFTGWYIRSDGQVRKGLVARRSGIGDGRKDERTLCLEGLAEGTTGGGAITAAVKNVSAQIGTVTPAARPPVRHKPRPAPIPCAWWRKCT